MKVLAVTSELPWPLDSGGHLRTFHLLKHVAAHVDLRLVVPVHAGQEPTVAVLNQWNIRVVPVVVAPRTKFAESKRLLNAQLHREPYVMYRRHARPEMFAAWEAEIRREKPDVAHLDHLDSFLFHEIAAKLGVPTVLDLHNVYSLILSRMADEQTNPLKKVFFRGEARRLAHIETRACRSVNAVLAVSSTEADHYRKLGAKAVHVAPNGVDCAAFQDLKTGRSVTPPVVMYLGTMSWGPNVTAAVYLAEEVFPKVRAKFPDAKLLLVGKDPCPEVRATARLPGVEVTGSVPSVRPYLEQASLLAVPLDSGGGTRLKILEAFAAGLPVVSTAVGAEGIDATAGEEIIIAERPDMAAAICDLIADPARGQRVAEQARRLAQQTYDWPMIGEKVVGVIRGLAKKS